MHRDNYIVCVWYYNAADVIDFHNLTCKSNNTTYLTIAKELEMPKLKAKAL